MTQDLTDTQLAAFRGALQALRLELEVQVRSAGQVAAPVELDQAAVGRVSRIDAIAQQQMAVERRRRAELRLALVHAALSRFDDDEYGLCCDCGDPIAIARLDARPESPHCMACARGRES